jgi:PAS domain S-box-containing protein
MSTDNIRLPEDVRFVDFDLENDPELLEIVELASAVTNSPFALIAIKQEDILYLKVRKGINQTAIPLETSFCVHAFSQNELLIVPDTLNDARFINHPSVTGASGIRFFATMTLIAPCGKVLGSLGVYDVKPNNLDDHQQLVLKILANQVMKILELRLGVKILEQKQKELEAHKELNNDASIRLRSFFESSANFQVLLGSSGEVIDFNKTAYNFVKAVHGQQLARDDQFVKYIHPAFVSTFIKRYNEALEGKKALEEGSTEYEQVGVIWWEAAFEAARNDKEEIIGVSYLIRNVTERKLKEQKIIDQNKSLLEIAHIQAHDFRAPLTSIMGLMNLIRDEDYEAPREYLEMLNEAVYILDDKIRSIVTNIDDMVITPYVPHYE